MATAIAASVDGGTVRKHPLANCEDCPLNEIGVFVPSCGPRQADVAIVGEAPGVNEAKYGEPFVGDSGQLLNKVLSHYKINRKEVLLTNACLCRDPEGGTPPAAAIQACRPRLLEEIRQREVKDIVALGNSASQSLLRTQVGVTSLRLGFGHYNEEELPGTRIVASFHPAACLRVPSFFPSFVNDVGKIKTSDGNAIWYEPDYKVFDDSESTFLALAEIDRRFPDNPITLDIETAVEKDLTFEQPGRQGLLCEGLGYSKGKVIVVGEQALKDSAVIEALRKFLARRRIRAQNGKFDLKGNYSMLGPSETRLWQDSMLMSYCLDERSGIHGLKYNSQEKLGSPPYDDEMRRYLPNKKTSFAVIPRDILYKYNACDVHATDLLCDYFWDLMEEEGPVTDWDRPGRINSFHDPGLRFLHDFLVQASNALMYLELNGMGVDLAYNAVIGAEYQSSLAANETKLADIITQYSEDPKWKTFNPRSPMQVKKVMKDVYGYKRLPMIRNLKGEQVETTNADALNFLLLNAKGKPSYPFLEALLDNRREAKMYGTYVKGVRQRTFRGRVYTTYLIHGTTTGRLSSRNPNLQNIPREGHIRQQFVPARPGHVLIQADYKQAELRMVCWLAKEPFLQAIFNDPNADLFSDTMVRLYGDEALELTKPEQKELRIRVKAYWYGVAYGRKAASIADEFSITLREAQDGLREFYSLIPRVKAWQGDTIKSVMDGEDLTTPFGRHRRFMLITPKNRHEIENEALAFRPQSISSDACLQAFTWVRPKLKDLAYPRNIVHDSIIAECLPENADIVGQIISEEMIKSAHSIVGDYVRFSTDITTGVHWGELI